MRTASRRLSLVGVGIAIAALVAAGTATAGANGERQARAAGTEVKVITHNICGGCDNNGNADAAAFAVAEIRHWNPHIVMLQEVCQHQFEWVKEQLAPDYTADFVPMRDSHDGCGGRPNGQVLAAKGTMSGKEVIDLNGDNYDADGRKYRALCYDVAITGLGKPVKSCVVHIRAFHEADKQWNFRARWAQLAKLATEMDDDLLAEGQPVVLGGDFNAHAHERAMDPLYQLKSDGTPGTFGMFAEADQTDKSFFTDGCTTACRTGENTMADRKYDYVFYSAKHASALSGGVKGMGDSDHNLYRGSAVLTL